MTIALESRTDALLPQEGERRDLLQQAGNLVERMFQRVEELPVAPPVRADTIRHYLNQFDFESPRDFDDVLEQVGQRMTDWSLHVNSPRYFGLFNPAPGYAGILADFLAAGFNSQLGAWHHNPFGVEVERHLIKYFTDRVGLGERAFGHFTSGGSEANFTSVVIAMSRLFPEYASQGLRALPAQPVFYCSREFHHSFEKIAHQVGLGRGAVRLVPVTERNVMDVEKAKAMIEADREAGLLPFMIVATAGTTNAGLIEPMESMADLAVEQGVHFHVDAAWGGSAILSDKHRGELAGLERADTITIDPHKLMSVPMGGGMILVRDHDWLFRTFGLKTDYVPSSETDGLDNYQQSFQFSRRFIGLKLFLQLAIVGQKKYGQLIDHQFEMAKVLASKLENRGFQIHNEASFGVVCFTPPECVGGRSHSELQQIADGICASGDAWISVTRLGGKSVLRACVTNHLTVEKDLDVLVDRLLNGVD